MCIFTLLQSYKQVVLAHTCPQCPLIASSCEAMRLATLEVESVVEFMKCLLLSAGKKKYEYDCSGFRRQPSHPDQVTYLQNRLLDTEVQRDLASGAKEDTQRNM